MLTLLFALLARGLARCGGRYETELVPEAMVPAFPARVGVDASQPSDPSGAGASKGLMEALRRRMAREKAAPRGEPSKEGQNARREPAKRGAGDGSRGRRKVKRRGARA